MNDTYNLKVGHKMNYCGKDFVITNIKHIENVFGSLLHVIAVDDVVNMDQQNKLKVLTLDNHMKEMLE